MPAMQVSQILDAVMTVHRELAAHYRDQSAMATNRELSLLFSDTAIREQRFASVVDEFESGAGAGILETWFQFVSDDVIALKESLANGPSVASLEEAVEQIQHLNRALGNAYREIANDTECAALQGLFQNLAQLEDNNDRHLSKLLLGE